MSKKVEEKTPSLNGTKSADIPSTEIHHNYCLYDDEQVKPDCPIQHTHAYWIGLRRDCRKCDVYQKWQRVHAKELEALRSASL